MDDGRHLCAALLEKLHEQMDSTSHLVSLVPSNRLEWAPPIPGAWPVSALLAHLLDCMAGFCAVLAAAEPVRLEHFNRLREWPVYQQHQPAEFQSKWLRNLKKYINDQHWLCPYYH